MPANDRLLVLLRHGQSDWNLKNLFTGWKDIDLSPQGVEEARAAGRRLKAHGLSFDLAFTSALIRAQHTLKLVLDELGQPGLPTAADQALNERDYGELSGLNKDDARQRWGVDQVQIWRRSYDVAPPGGESLKDTVARALPYYCQHILPAVLSGRRVLVSAHGNSLRALVMVLDRMTPKTIPDAGARHRRAAGLPAERQFDRRIEGGAGGVSRAAAQSLTVAPRGRPLPRLSRSRRPGGAARRRATRSSRSAPLFQPRMPRTGKPFSVRMTNCGPLGWVSDAGGYRYQARHPVTGAPWPAMPAIVLEAWAELAAQAPPPEACLINFYDPTARDGAASGPRRGGVFRAGGVAVARRRLPVPRRGSDARRARPARSGCNRATR